MFFLRLYELKIHLPQMVPMVVKAAASPSQVQHILRWKDQVAREKCLTVCPPMANDDEYNDDVSNIHLYAYMRWVQFDFLSNQMICIQCCIDLTLNLWQIESLFARYWSFRQSVEHGNVAEFVEVVRYAALDDSYTTMIRVSHCWSDMAWSSAEVFLVKWHGMKQCRSLSGRAENRRLDGQLQDGANG